ncbi:MAG: hypothetical protein WD059_06095 [Balneolaceae bacterium]
MREIRTLLFSYQLNETLIERVENNPNLSFHQLDTRLVYFNYSSPDFQKYWHYKVPFGSFFFVSIVGLLAVGADRKYFYSIIIVHTTVLLITSAIFLLDVSTYYWLLIICDLLSRYLIPLCSIGMIPLAVIDKRRSKVGFQVGETESTL